MRHSLPILSGLRLSQCSNEHATGFSIYSPAMCLLRNLRPVLADTLLCGKSPSPSLIPDSRAVPYVMPAMSGEARMEDKENIPPGAVFLEHYSGFKTAVTGSKSQGGEAGGEEERERG